MSKDAIKPVYEREGVTVYHGDCLDILPQLEDGIVDAVVTDPPYGIARSNHGGMLETRPMLANDESQDVGVAALAWCERLAIPVAAFASPRKPWPGVWRNLIVWDKGGAVAGGGDIQTCLKLSWELIQVARNGRLSRRDVSVWRHVVTQADFENHPTEKPVALIIRLLATVFAAETTILDPFMGSGTTGVACVNIGRNFIGIELESQYVDTAICRIERAFADRAERLPLPPVQQGDDEQDLFSVA